MTQADLFLTRAFNSDACVNQNQLTFFLGLSYGIYLPGVMVLDFVIYCSNWDIIKQSQVVVIAMKYKIQEMCYIWICGSVMEDTYFVLLLLLKHNLTYSN